METSQENSYGGEERRKAVIVKLSDEQIDAIVDRVYERIYIQIGKNVFKQILWLLGTLMLATLAYLGVTGKIQIK